MLEDLAVVVVFRVLGRLGGLFQRGVDIQLRRRGFFDFADIDLVELLGLLLLHLIGLRLQNGRVALIVVAAEVRQQQQDRKREEVKTETAGVPDQFGPHPVHETFRQGFFLELIFVLDRQRVVRGFCHERSPFRLNLSSAD